MSDLLYLTAAAPVKLLEAAEGDDSPGTFIGTAYTGDAMRISGFAEPIVVDLDGMSIANSTLPMLRDHKGSQIVGHSTTITAETGKLAISGILSGSNQFATEVRASGKQGFPWGLSIGAEVVKLERVEKGTTITANGRTFNGPILLAKETRLREVSFVASGADHNTSATITAMATHGGNPMSETTTTPDDNLEAEELRVETIEAAISDYPSEQASTIAAEAIKGGWSADRAKVAMLRASRQPAPAPAGHVKGGDSAVTSLQAGLLARCNANVEAGMNREGAMALDLPDWVRADRNSDVKQRVLEAGWANRHKSLYDICVDIARHEKGYLSAQSREKVIEAAFSGSTFSDVFTANASALVLSSYMAQADTTRGGWIRETDHRDFKDIPVIRTNPADQLEKLPRGKTASHESFEDATETFKLARYAKQFVVDDQDIFDDRLNVLAETPRKFGAAAARLRPDLVYSLILQNPTLAADGNSLFDETNHSNLKTSAALAAATLRTAIAALETMQERNLTLNLIATHVLTPPTLKHTAATLLNSMEVRNTTDSTEYGTQNTLASHENLQLVSEGRLENGVDDPSTDPPTTRTGASDHWYLISAFAHVIEVGYLMGTGRVPTVRMFRLDKGQWGVGWDVKMDIGAQALDYRGIIRNDA